MFTGPELLILIGIGLGLGFVVVAIMGGSSKRKAGSVKAKMDTLFGSTYKHLLSADTQRVSAIAFSKNEPGAMGWKRDIGELLISPAGLHLVSPKQHLAFKAPVKARLYKHDYLFWHMIHVEGELAESGEASTVLLVVRGCPKSKFAGKPGEIEQESRALIDTINQAAS